MAKIAGQCKSGGLVALYMDEDEVIIFQPETMTAAEAARKIANHEKK